MNAEIRDGRLHIDLAIGEPVQSKSGKTFVVATSHGNMPTAAKVGGQTVYVGVNAYIREAPIGTVKASTKAGKKANE